MTFTLISILFSSFEAFYMARYLPLLMSFQKMKTSERPPLLFSLCLGTLNTYLTRPVATDHARYLVVT